ncbi:tail completion protein gp17 [Sphingomonas sp. Leaf257]|jgi:hypothetical protein|uniref:tail completion protein gp17 n=1 Tax=Sphingomonas sp. Leaf257 TaxID=1736309 RepID=UPI0007007DEE|nr:DUF3168 domain-containing protein [Sphingomonas sp. Leaf257]KQO53366.1 hypothetical protein ASF14_20380 [Sphingomonas sp. Leaf257]
MIEKALYSLLSAIAPNTYPVVAPKGVKVPFVIYTRVSTPRLRDFNGPTGNAMPTFRIDAYDVGFDAARALADSIRVALDGHRGGIIQDCVLINEQDLSDLTSDPALSRVQLEFRVSHTE